MRHLLRAWAVAAVALALPWQALAQSVPPPATQNAIDSNGVDLVNLSLFVSSPSASVGQPGAGGLVYQRTYDSSIQDWRDNVTGTINASGASYTVTLLGASETFTLSGSSYTSTEGRGGTLTMAGNVYTYTTASGAIALYDTVLASSQPTQANQGRVTQLTLPSGERLTFTYTQLSASPFLAHRLQSVNNNLGYQLSFEYQSNSADATGIQLKEVTAINNAVDYCAPTANGCTGFTQPWMSLAFGFFSGYQTVTDALGRVMRYTIASNRITGIRWPSSSSDDITISYDGAGKVYQVSNANGAWTYQYQDTGPVRELSVTDPANDVRVYFSNLSISRITGFEDGEGQAWQFTYDSLGRLQTEFRPQGGYTANTRDGRGNVTQVSVSPNDGASGPTPFTLGTANYPSTCTTAVVCNQPTATADALGATTDYTYDSTHGGLLTVTAPDPDGGGALPRPQTRYTYAQVTASYIQSSSGSPTPASSSVWRLTEISSCATSTWTGSACGNGTADETRTTIAYGTNNQLPTVITQRSGDSALVAPTTLAYDDIGNVIEIDGPLDPAADITRVRYDNGRQQIGVIGPDPDAGGALEHRALRYNYNQDGQVTSVERGTVDSQSDAHWAAFASLETMSMAYDAVGRLTRESLVVSGTTQALTQYSYDNANKLDCVAVRMNPAEFGSLPASACSLDTEGANGPDRITRSIYDDAGRVVEVQTGYGTALQQTTMAQTFTENGMAATLSDANGNVTTYEYDGIDRLARIRFPNASGGGSSTSDYEEFTYNANGMVTQRRLREGAVIGFGYDDLSRLVTINAPSGTPDVTRTYDNFGRLTSAAQSGHTLSFVYDQLSRMISTTRVANSVTHVVGYQYDIAGNRTRVSWPDGFYAQYDYDLTGAVTHIRENGASSGVGVLAQYAYDNLGRRTSMTRAGGAGAVTTYTYDAASRLSSLAHDYAGSASDQTYNFTYNAAGQIVSRSGAYAWTQPSPSATSYTANGRNQYTNVGGSSFSYDGRGNLSTTPADTYSYDAFNRMTSFVYGMALGYDPLGRLYETSLWGYHSRFLYDGTDMIMETNASTGAISGRYVYGPGVDEPIVWYDGASTNDRRFLMTDERGSIAATSNPSAVLGYVFPMDEFGQPDPNTPSRFRFTGQMWMGWAYHFKARAYLPEWGRFMQSDPILYAGGPNLYAYVNNDPINFTDPLGLQNVPGDPSTGTTTVTRERRDPRETSSGRRVSILLNRAALLEVRRFSRDNNARIRRIPLNPDELVVTAQPLPDIDWGLWLIRGATFSSAFLTALLYPTEADIDDCRALPNGCLPTSSTPEEIVEQCDELHQAEQNQCNLLRMYGRESEIPSCRNQATTRYAECIRYGGPDNIRSPPYPGPWLPLRPGG